MEIPNINITSRGITIRTLDIPEVPEWLRNPPQAIPPISPVTTQLGTPIINIPGCVEANANDRGKNDNLITDDSNGNRTYCDSGLPSFNPLDFEPEQIVPTAPAGVDTRGLEPEPDVPEPKVDVPKTPPSTANIDCPTAAQEAKEPVGTLINGFRDKVIGYKLIGNECIQETESVPIQVQLIEGLPSGGQVIQVGGIAVVATTSALLAKPLADILLKVVKPTVKKVIKKIAKIRGKEVKVQSISERRNEQRERNHAIMSLRKTFKK